MPSTRPNYVWIAMKTKKLHLTRKLSPLERVFSFPTALLFCLGATVGDHLYMEGTIASSHYGLHSFFWYLVGGLVAHALASCYAELTAIAPCTGGAYSYSYNAIGELEAFFVGWFMILARSFYLMYSARVFSDYVNDNYFNGTFIIFDPTGDEEGKALGGFFAMIITAGIASTVIKESIRANTILVLLNVIILLCVLLTLIFVLDFDFKRIQNSDVDFVYNKFLKGFKTANDVYLGVHAAAFLGAETQDPEINVPNCLNAIVPIAFLSYSLFSVVYMFLLDKARTASSTDVLSKVLENLNIGYFFTSIVNLGCTCSLASSCYASMFVLVRILYTMSSDGLIINVFRKVDHRTNNLVWPTFLVALILGMVIDYFTKTNLLSISSFLMYFELFSIPICLLITRYRFENENIMRDVQSLYEERVMTDTERPTKETETISRYVIAVIILLSILLSLAFFQNFVEPHLAYKTIFGISIVMLLLLSFFLSWLPKNDRRNLHSRVLGVPYLQVLLIVYCTMVLMLHPIYFWLISVSWLFIGLIIYFTYSRKYSVEAGKVYPQDREERWNLILEPKLFPDLNLPEEDEAARSTQGASRAFWSLGQFFGRNN